MQETVRCIEALHREMLKAIIRRGIPLRLVPTHLARFARQAMPEAIFNMWKNDPLAEERLKEAMKDSYTREMIEDFAKQS